jgi:hypothetical protein
VPFPYCTTVAKNVSDPGWAPRLHGLNPPNHQPPFAHGERGFTTDSHRMQKARIAPEISDETPGICWFFF